MDRRNGTPHTGPIPVGQEPPPMTPRPAPANPSPSPERRGAGKAKGDRKRVVRGRFLTLNAFVDFTLAELTPAEVAVWLVLFRDCRNGLACTGQADIARRAGVCRKTVFNAIRRLAERGLLRVVRRGRLSSGASTYRLRWLIPE